MNVKEVMNKAIVIEHDVSAKEAAKLMSDRGIGSLIVLKNNKIAGIITERDIIKNVSCLGKKVFSIMSKSVVTIGSDESLEDAALIMTGRKIKRLPVLENGKLAGIITATDIIANSDLLNEDFLID